MMAATTGNGSLTPKPVPASPTANKPFEADKPEPKSPNLLATEPVGPPDEELVELERRKTQEDEKGGSEDREVDIYADAVLQCSIENREACEMCSG
jgi:ribonucleoside-diphosphate reductase subunit M1